MFVVVLLAGPSGLILIDTFAALARGWRFGSRLDYYGTLAVAAAFTSILLVALVPQTRKRIMRKAPQLCLAGVAIIVSLAGAEIAARVLLPMIESPIHLRRPHTQTIYHPVPGVMRGIEGPSVTRINSWGVRGTEPPQGTAVTKVLCLGASSTNCTYLDDGETWAALLEAYLNSDSHGIKYWVGNAGIPSITTQEHLRFLQSSAVPGACNILVLQFGINDFMQAIAQPRPAGPIWLNSSLWRMATTVARRFLNSPDIHVEDQAGSSYVRRRHERIKAAKTTQLPDLEQALRAFSDRVRLMIKSARQLGLRVIVTSQPVMWTSSPTADDERLFWFGRGEGNTYLATPQLRDGMDQFNSVTREVCNDTNAEFIDLSDLNGRADVFYDDCHYTEEGARQVARRIANYLISHPVALQPGQTSTTADDKGPLQTK